VNIHGVADADRHEHPHLQNRFAVLPTPLRVRSNTQRTGKGVTIAFIDSGFYPHPDMTQPRNRIRDFFDSTDADPPIRSLDDPRAWEWHGTQTSVVATGNGHLSEGVYRGVAPDAEVVLVKAIGPSADPEKTLVRALEWVLENRERHNIRVVSISIGGGEDLADRESLVEIAAEELIRHGIVVIAAAGNSGCTADYLTGPPASSPSVIAVGGYDDKNRLDGGDPDLYCSSYGPTSKGLLKPEIIAPAIWVAAPILPSSEFASKAEALSILAAASDALLPGLIRELGPTAELSADLARQKPQAIRAAIDEALLRNKIVATHYQHVDGTSFAAPITAAVVAQMLEANPSLTPAAVKHILVSTARRIHGAPLLRQGYGMLDAAGAVQMATQEMHAFDEDTFSPPRVEGDKLVISYHSHEARSVALAGEFNGWDAQRNLLLQDLQGTWRAAIDLPPPGRYRYKLVVDETRWIEDPSNGRKEPDGYGGFNSVLDLEAAAD
jgi:serine protease AprX